MRVVLDASVAVKWFLDDEEFVPEARVLFEALRADQISFCAPGTLMCNAFAKLSRCTHIADFKL